MQESETATAEGSGEGGPVEVADELVPAELKDMHALVVQSADFSQFGDGLLAMYREAHGVVFNLAKTRDNEAARSLRKRLVSTRTAIEKRRVDGNRADRESIALRIAKRDELASTLVDIVRGLEDPIDEAIRADEERRDREAEERRQAEEKRIGELRQRVDDITAVATRAVGMGSAEIEAKLALVGRITVDESFQELEEAAHRAKADTILALNELLTAARRQEAERAEAERNRAELEHLRAEQARRDQQEAEARAQREREAEEARRREDEARQLRQRQQQAAQDAVAEIQAAMRGAMTATAEGVGKLKERVWAVKAAIDCGDFQGQWQHAQASAMEQLNELQIQKADQERAAAFQRAEAARAQQIRTALETIKSYHSAYAGEPDEADAIEQSIVTLKAMQIDEATFGDMQVVAGAVKTAAIDELQRLLALARTPRPAPQPAPEAPPPAASQAATVDADEPQDAPEEGRADIAVMEPGQLYFGLLGLCARVARDARRTPAAANRGGPWLVPAALIQELRDTLPKVPMPGGQFYSGDGTLMNVDGTRSIFDDVDQ